jgi:hypothetical protein
MSAPLLWEFGHGVAQYLANSTSKAHLEHRPSALVNDFAVAGLGVTRCLTGWLMVLLGSVTRCHSVGREWSDVGWERMVR